MTRPTTQLDSMRALSIRQPYAELILRGMKQVEYRSRPTNIVGERFWIYASKGGGDWTRRPAAKKPAASRTEPRAGGIWSRELAVETPAPWMLELASALRLFPERLPTGVIVGSAVIDRIIEPAHEGDLFQWVLSDVRRLKTPLKPRGHPQPVWWRPLGI